MHSHSAHRSLAFRYFFTFLVRSLEKKYVNTNDREILDDSLESSSARSHFISKVDH